MQKHDSHPIVIFLMHFAIICTIISQIPEFQAGFRPLMFTFWFAAMVYAILGNRSVLINSYIKTFALAMIFILLHNIIGFFIYQEIAISNYFRVALIPLFIYFTMFQISGYIKPMQFNGLLINYCISSVFYALYLYVVYVPSLNDWLATKMYIYTSKNSAAQIFITAAILLLFFLRGKDLLSNTLRILGSIILLFLSILLQCRAVLVAFAGVVFYIFFIKSNNKQRLWAIITLICLIVIILSSESLNDFFSHAFFLDKYENADLNTISSGRLEQYEVALSDFAKSPLIGKISYYVDCMYISVYTALGIFGGTAILLPWFKRISKNFQLLRFAKQNNSSARLEYLVCYLTVFYLITSIMEGYPPFGPGACSVVFWMICSYLDSTYYKPSRKNKTLSS